MIKPVDFPEKNIQIETEIKDFDFPAHATVGGDIVTCWKISFWGRVKLLFCGRLWVRVKTNNLPVHFFWLYTQKPFHKKG